MNHVHGDLHKPAAWLQSHGLAHQFLTRARVTGVNPHGCTFDSHCLPLGQRGAWDAKAAGAIIGEKLGRNGKQEMKEENKHSLPNSHTAVVPG